MNDKKYYKLTLTSKDKKEKPFTIYFRKGFKFTAKSEHGTQTLCRDQQIGLPHMCYNGQERVTITACLDCEPEENLHK